MPEPVTLGDIIRAGQRLGAHLGPTPLEAAPKLGENAWLKLENANKTHSFKIRGALNAILSLDETARAKGIIAASSGNHAGAVAYAADLADASARILMPLNTPEKKIDNVRRYGAEAILFGDNYDQAEAEALRMAAGGGTWVSPYNDAKVIAGAGTIGLEVVAQLPDVERVVVPVSGGGLIAGVATAVKGMNPEIKVIGVNAASAPAMYNHFYGSDKPQVWETLAEALSGEIEAGSITVPIARRLVDDMALVTERQIADAMRYMIEAQGWVVEGGGAVGVAALLHDVLPRDGAVTAVLVSGGNVDGDVLRRVLCSSGSGPKLHKKAPIEEAGV
ncbi:MAG: threonine/serine dehydratase [Chloroflexi bacterium]|nr:threonine/serine dehydratase [Chloroflexota bacterium]